MAEVEKIVTAKSQQESFLDALRADPDCETARLVYADWLEEFGGAPDLAEWIRLQVGVRHGVAPSNARRTEMWDDRAFRNRYFPAARHWTIFDNTFVKILTAVRGGSLSRRSFNDTYSYFYLIEHGLVRAVAAGTMADGALMTLRTWHPLQRVYVIPTDNREPIHMFTLGPDDEGLEPTVLRA
jgi:uncharacterized protein (TIGR02996 family)